MYIIYAYDKRSIHTHLLHTPIDRGRQGEALHALRDQAPPPAPDFAAFVRGGGTCLFSRYTLMNTLLSPPHASTNIFTYKDPFIF